MSASADKSVGRKRRLLESSSSGGSDSEEKCALDASHSTKKRLKDVRTNEAKQSSVINVAEKNVEEEQPIAAKGNEQDAQGIGVADDEHNHWYLHSTDTIRWPSMALEFVPDEAEKKSIAVIGRSHFAASSYRQYLSEKHCYFAEILADEQQEEPPNTSDSSKGKQKSNSASSSNKSMKCSVDSSIATLQFTSLAKFDTILVDKKLAKKGHVLVVKDGTQFAFCSASRKSLFTYTLCRVTGKDRGSASSSTAISTSGTSTSTSRAAIYSMHDVSSTKEEVGDHEKEWVAMGIADVESALVARRRRALDITMSVSRGVQSAFGCDICLQTIAACRACVPCGHCYCGPCIDQVIKAAAPRNNAMCPRCRAHIQRVIPNKAVDNAISASITMVHQAARASVSICNNNTAAAAVTVAASSSSSSSSSSASSSGLVVSGIVEIAASSDALLVSESQDIALWSERREENERYFLPPAPALPAIRRGETVGINNNRAGPVVVDLVGSDESELDSDFNSDDDRDDGSDDDDSDDDSQGDDEDDGDTLNCADALIENARSGQSRCILCLNMIARGALRIGIADMHEHNYVPIRRYIHLNCVREFNAHRYNTVSLHRLAGTESYPPAVMREIIAAFD